MGTVYTVKIAQSPLDRDELEAVRNAVDELLVKLNAELSTYDANSAISRFNRQRTTSPVPASATFREVTQRALELSATTDGAFDPTLGPWIDLWGFGASGPRTNAPRT
jgi:thiamine biosynthesis lipoprotein